MDWALFQARENGIAVMGGHMTEEFHRYLVVQAYLHFLPKVRAFTIRCGRFMAAFPGISFREAYSNEFHYKGIKINHESFRSFTHISLDACVHFKSFVACVEWLLDAFVWTRLIHDGDRAVATRVFDFLVA